MKAKELISDHGRVSATKLWFNIGYAAITFGYIWSIMHGFSFESATMVYAPFVGGTKVFEKFLMLKFGAVNVQPPTS